LSESNDVVPNEVQVKLVELKLDMYSNVLVDTQGFDVLSDLTSLTEAELESLANECGMKPAHKKRFVQAFSPSESVPLGTPVQTAGVVESPAVSTPNLEDSNMKQTRASAIEFETSAIGLEMQKQEIQKLKMELEEKADKKEREKDAEMQKLKMEMQEERKEREKQAEMQKFKMEMEEKAERKEREKDTEMKMKMEMQEMRTSMDNKLLESKLQQQSVDMQQNLVASMAKPMAMALPVANPISPVATPTPTAIPMATHVGQTIMPKATMVTPALDPQLVDVQKKFIDLDSSDWNHLNSVALQQTIDPMIMSYNACKPLYDQLELQIKVTRPAFSKLKEGSSRSGKPKTPIEAKSHPDYRAGEAYQKSFLNDPKFCFDDQPRRDKLLSYGYFMSEPVYSKFLSSVYKFDASKLNKNGKHAAATSVIATADQAHDRLKTQEGRVLRELEAKIAHWQQAVIKLQQEESAVGSCCGCVIA